MERVRLNECGEIRVLVDGLRKLSGELIEVLERTPPTISSRHFLEDSYKLSYSLLVVASRLYARYC